MIKFEPVSKYKDAELPLPTRGTKYAAGYDFVVAEDIVIPSYSKLIEDLNMKVFLRTAWKDDNDLDSPKTREELEKASEDMNNLIFTLDEMAELTKGNFTKIRPTLVSTGMKCYLDPGTYLELCVRSSTPLKYWLICANSVGVIDADYVDNPDNEGEIFFQLINLSPFAIQLKKGDKIGQGIIKPYLVTDDDVAGGDRMGGFGSTSNKDNWAESEAQIKYLRNHYSVGQT